MEKKLSIKMAIMKTTIIIKYNNKAIMTILLGDEEVVSLLFLLVFDNDDDFFFQNCFLTMPMSTVTLTRGVSSIHRQTDGRTDRSTMTTI